jgi:ADP-heptose:LPS heptosyltransferase
LSFAKHFWSKFGLKEEEQVLAIHPGSGSPAKNWDAKKFARVADWASERCKVLLISGPAQDGVEEVRRTMKKANPLVADNLPLLHLAAVFKASRAYLGNDSGITHLAASLGLPTIALFGPTNPAIWGPRGPAVQIVYGKNPWLPSSPPQSESSRQCLESIQPDSVIDILSRLFKECV